MERFLFFCYNRVVIAMKKKENKYWKEQMLERILSGAPSLFLNHKQYCDLCRILNKKGIIYFTWECFKDSDYKIIYTKRKPSVTVFEIVADENLTHPMIMGSLYGLQLEEGYFGDIIAGKPSYIFLLSSMSSYIEKELTMIGKYRVELQKASLPIQYERSFKDKKIMVSSLRMDQVVSKITSSSRNKGKEYFMNEEVMVNDEVCKNTSYILKEEDTFSIRRHGKYKVVETGKTRRDKYVIHLKQYQ